MREDKSELDSVCAELDALKREVDELKDALRNASRRSYASLREHLRCPSCGATSVVYAPRVLDRAESGREALSLVQPSIWSARGIGELALYFCRSCGFAEWYLKDPGSIETDGEKLRSIDGSRGGGDPYRS